MRYDDIPALQAAAPNVRVVQGSLRSVDPERKTAVVALHADAGTTDAATTEVPYDYFVTATGLRRVWPVVPQSLRRKQYLFEAGDHIRNVTNARHDVVVVGGGTRHLNHLCPTLSLPFFSFVPLVVLTNLPSLT